MINRDWTSNEENLNSVLRSSAGGFVSGTVSGYFGSEYSGKRVIENGKAGGIGSCFTCYVRSVEAILAGQGMIGDCSPLGCYQSHEALLKDSTNHSNGLLFALPITLGAIVE